MVKIKDIVASTTSRNGKNFLIIKVETDAPHLYGVGCAAIQTGGSEYLSAVSELLRPALIGRDIDETRNCSAVVPCRNGTDSVALGAVDLALWNLRGKSEGVSAYELLEQRRPV